MRSLNILHLNKASKTSTTRRRHVYRRLRHVFETFKSVREIKYIMGFWFFRKKREEKEVEVVGPIQSLHNNLKTSFSRIRSDIQVVRDWLTQMKDKDQDQDHKINELSNKIEELGDVLAYMQKSQNRLREEILRVTLPPIKKDIPITTNQPPKQETEEEPIMIETSQPTNPSALLENLTETQQAMFLRLGTIMNEAGQEWIPLKALAQELYPEKEYPKVRSTVSEYADILGEFYLLDKKRRGKQSYVTLSKKGKQIFNKDKKKQEVKVKKQD